MPDTNLNLINVILFVAVIGFVPLILVTTTGFLKLAVVMFLIRNALGVQQAPPNIVLYGIALVLTVYVTSPLLGEIYTRISAHPLNVTSIESLTETANNVRQPVQAYLPVSPIPMSVSSFSLRPAASGRIRPVPRPRMMISLFCCRPS